MLTRCRPALPQLASVAGQQVGPDSGLSSGEPAGDAY